MGPAVTHKTMQHHHHPTIQAVPVFEDHEGERLEGQRPTTEVNTSTEHVWNTSGSTANNTIWTWILTTFPLLFQSAYFHLFRSLVLGHVVTVVLQPDWHKQLVKAGKAWPPPSFLLLAGLTVVTLVVHPDGYTWVLLRQIR